MRRSSIKMSILAPSLIILILGIAALVGITGILSSNTTNDITDQLMSARVGEYSNEFLLLSQSEYRAIDTIVPLIESYLDPTYAANAADPRGEIIDMLSKVLLANDKIASVWTCWEPDAFDGMDSVYAGTSFYDATGRFVPYVYRDGAGVAVEPLIDYDDPVVGEYYQGARSSGVPYITDPYLYDFGGRETCIYSAAIPIVKDGRVLGAVGADIDMSEIITMMNAGSILTDGYLYTISPGGLLATHSNPDLLMKSYMTTWMKGYSTQVEDALKNGGSFAIHAYSDVTNTNMSFLGAAVKIGDTGRNWLICGVVPEKTVEASSTALVLTIICAGVALIVVTGLTIFLVVRVRLKELPTLTAAAEALALGEIDMEQQSVVEGNTHNEIDLLSRAFTRMVAGIREQARVLAEIAEGNYSLSLNVRSDKDVMNKAINNMLESTNNMLGQINATSAQVSSGANQIAEGAQVLAQGSTEQASAVEELSASISEIADKTTHNAQISREAAELTDAIRIGAQKSGDQMNHLMQAVKEINDSSQSISKVIKVIDDIAFQTNILALNAAVEAARAGSAGKGFAVVAGEVRNLAAKSAEAAKDTGTLIGNSMEKADLGLNIATDTSASLTTIVNDIVKSAQIISRIAQSSDEQATAIVQVNQGIEQVAMVVQQNSATAEESAAAAEELSGQSGLLAELIAQFKLREGM